MWAGAGQRAGREFRPRADLEVLFVVVGPGRVVRRDGLAWRRIDPQDAAEEVVERLAGHTHGNGRRVGAAVADCDIEIPVGTELHHAAVVVGRRLHEGKQHPPRRPIDEIVVGDRSSVLDDADVAVAVVEIRVQEPADRIVGSKRDREQPLFALRPDDAAQVEERIRPQSSVLDQGDEAVLLDDEQPGPVPRWSYDVGRRPEPALDQGQHELRPRRRRRRGRGDAQRPGQRRRRLPRSSGRAQDPPAHLREPHHDRGLPARTE